MPKQAAPHGRKPVRVLHVEDRWRQSHQSATRGYTHSTDVLEAWGNFLSDNASQSAQVAALRKIHHVLAKSGANPSLESVTSSLIHDHLLPFLLDLHFLPTLPTESSFRSAVFSLVELCNEIWRKGPPDGEYSPDTIEDALHERFTAFISNANSVDASKTDLDLSHFGAVLLTTLDRPVGRIVVRRSFVLTLETLTKTVTCIVKDIEDLNARSGATAARLHLSAKFQSCSDMLKVTVGLVTKFPGELNPGPLGNDDNEEGQPHIVQQLLDVGFGVCFSQLFLPENRFMAGILIASLLDHIEPPSKWMAALFGPDGMGKGGLSRLFSKGVHVEAGQDWVSAAGYEYSGLAIYRGILSTIPISKLLMEVETVQPQSLILTQEIDDQTIYTVPPFASAKQSLLSMLYERITFISDRASESSTRVLAFQTLATWLGVVRDGLAKSIDQDDASRTSLVALVSPEICQRIFAYVFDAWEDPVDVIQHKLKDVFQALLDVLELIRSSNGGSQSFFMVDSLIKADWHRKVKYDLLSILLTRISSREIIRMHPDFVSICFDVMRNPMMASRISAFIAKFFKQAFSERGPDDDDEWWLIPMSHALTSDSHVVRKFMSETMLSSILKGQPVAARELLKALSGGANRYIANRGYRLHGTVAVLKTSRLLDYVDINKILTEDRHILDQAISHPDLNLRVDVLAFLCESHRAITDFSPEEFAILRSCLLLSLDSQSPEYRQRVYGNLQKLLRRIRRTLYANWRDSCSRRDYLARYNVSAGEQPSNLEQMRSEMDAIARKMSMKQEFLQWLCDEAVTAVFPGSSFQRANSNLQLMSTILDSEEYEIDGNTKVDLADMPGYPTLVTERTVQVLLGIMFNDTYVPNRQKAFELLMRFPVPLPGFLDKKDVRMLLMQGIARVGSIKSMESEAGCVIVRLVFAKYVNSLGMFLDPLGEADIDGQRSPTAFFIGRFLEMIKRNVDVASKNLYLCATEYPMHGLFGALKAILSEVTYDSPAFTENRKEWQETGNTVIALVNTACQAVLEVCSDASPEGNLPASFADMQQNMEDLIADAGDFIAVPGEKGFEAQLILYQCFHTIKEATGVLETLICSPPLPASKDDTSSIVRFDQIVAAGTLLKVLLGSIRHRGAFSAVHVCFSHVCTTLLSSGKDFLADLPRGWLDDFFAQVLSSDVSVTRRSAGLPLGVLAIVAAPVPSRTILLATTMQRLFAIAKEAVPESANEGLDLPQVHAYNIIRTIVQDAEVATEVRDHTSDAFMLSIRGFSSSKFPIRNAAAMLFTTLVTKILGAKKSRDEMHAINTMTAREFFTRFPKLHPVLLEELDCAVKLLEQNKIHPALYPILTILARLKPSVLEATDTPLTATPFAPIVVRCSSASIFKAREMAARAYAPLVPSSELISTILKLLQTLSPARQNHLHGVLLMVQSLLRIHLAKGVAGVKLRKADIIKVLPGALTALSWIFESNPCPVTNALFVAMLREFIVDAQWTQDPDNTELAQLASSEFARLRKTIWTHCRSSLAKSTPGQLLGFAVRRENALLVLHGLPTSGVDASEWTIIASEFLDDFDYEVQLVTLEYIATVFLENVDGGLEEVRSPIKLNTIKLKCMAIASSDTGYYRVPLEAAKLLSRLGGDPTADRQEGRFISDLWATLVQRMVGTSKPHVAEAVLPLLGSLVAHATQANSGVPRDTAKTWAQEFATLIAVWSEDEQPLSVREAVVDALRNLRSTSVETILPETVMVDIGMVMMKLMEDDDVDVREDVAVMVSTLLRFEEPVTASRCRAALGLQLASKPYSAVGGGHAADRSIQMLLGKVSIESLLEGELRSTGTLFEKEDHNSHHEHVVDIFLAATCLDTLLQTHPSLTTRTISTLTSWLTDATARLQNTGKTGADLVAFTSRPRVFAAYASVACAVNLVNKFGGESAIGGVTGKALHPLLEDVMDGRREGRWGLLKAICTSFE
ncbi:hypothetical protein HK104_010089 [Borealophlyctis nickersoniae]|nr:hypothetical protein HK104_010089 [Borealophlyctis nickersoniae]